MSETTYQKLNCSIRLLDKDFDLSITADPNKNLWTASTAIAFTRRRFMHKVHRDARIRYKAVEWRAFPSSDDPDTILVTACLCCNIITVNGEKQWTTKREGKLNYRDVKRIAFGLCRRPSSIYKVDIKRIDREETEGKKTILWNCRLVVKNTALNRKEWHLVAKGEECNVGTKNFRFLRG